MFPPTRYVEGLAELVVKNHGDVRRLLMQGNAVRQIASTKMNHVSSRCGLGSIKYVVDGTKSQPLDPMLSFAFELSNVRRPQRIVLDINPKSTW